MNTNYQRVIPRDLFNESKLLKCIGRLVLLIHDNLAPQFLTFDYDGEPFIIGLTYCGHLKVKNINFSYDNFELEFKTVYNSKADYPFYCDYDNCEYLVFDENGNFDEEFLNLLEEIKNIKDER